MHAKNIFAVAFSICLIMAFILVLASPIYFQSLGEKTFRDYCRDHHLRYDNCELANSKMELGDYYMNYKLKIEYVPNTKGYIDHYLIMVPWGERPSVEHYFTRNPHASPDANFSVPYNGQD